ncbi:MAG: hypothetical protein RLZZ563_1262 [Pseudomonadota bacterium]
MMPCVPRPERHLIAADPQAVRDLLLALEAGTQMAALTPDSRECALLVLAEALNNVVEHGYPDAVGWIGLLPVPGRAGLAWRIVDAGRPVPELAQLRVAMPDGPAEGGFGWPLIRALTDEVRLSRRRGWNILTLRMRRAEGVLPCQDGVSTGVVA